MKSLVFRALMFFTLLFIPLGMFGEDIFEATENGDTNAIMTYIKDGNDVNVKDEDGWTVLMLAADNGDPETVGLLIDNGAEYGKDYKTADHYTYLMAFSAVGMKEQMKELIDEDADVNAKNDDGWTALMLAADNGDPEAVKLLIDAKADVNMENEEGATALKLALENNDKDVIDLLKKSGAKE